MTTQLAFRLSRRTDPDTSRRAGESARQLRAEHHGKILAALTEPLTYREVALKAGLDPVQVGRRMGELVALGKVRVCGERKLSTGRAGRVFKRTE